MWASNALFLTNVDFKRLLFILPLRYTVEFSTHICDTEFLRLGKFRTKLWGLYRSTKAFWDPYVMNEQNHSRDDSVLTTASAVSQLTVDFIIPAPVRHIDN